MKASVLDPQGQTICAALHRLGHREVLSVRQGKYFEVELPQQISRAAADQTVKEIARDVLSNSVIEDYRVEILE